MFVEKESIDTHPPMNLDQRIQSDERYWKEKDDAMSQQNPSQNSNLESESMLQDIDIDMPMLCGQQDFFLMPQGGQQGDLAYSYPPVSDWGTNPTDQTDSGGAGNWIGDINETTVVSQTIRRLEEKFERDEKRREQAAKTLELATEALESAKKDMVDAYTAVAKRLEALLEMVEPMEPREDIGL